MYDETALASEPSFAQTLSTAHPAHRRSRRDHGHLFFTRPCGRQFHPGCPRAAIFISGGEIATRTFL
ncbi:phage filamentation protein Fil family protein [Paraburkholderia diazotrophica]|uniref:phage filamentation protein Fil family protein n=1 Tax=Paraburkholderia diazotrophica TaxID=667676 RepID=UPI003D16BE35